MAQQSTKEVRMYLRIRNLCGLLGILLPWIALFAAAIAPHESKEWWWSISATYYLSPVALVGVLVPACIVMMSYIGYNWVDNLVTTLNGIAGLGIVLFPCKVNWIPDGTPVGFFQLPIELSSRIHMVCAILFFLFAAFNTLFLFTRHGSTMTEKKKLRNRIYRICGWGMLVLLALLIALSLIFGTPNWFVMIIEILLLHLFGFAWVVKGEFFPFLNDQAAANGRSGSSTTRSRTDSSIRVEVDD